MTAVLSTQSPQGATTPSSPSASSTPPQSHSIGETTSSKPTSSSPSLDPIHSSSTTSRSQHLAAPTSASAFDNQISKPRSRSRDSGPSRRQSRLSTRTASTRPTSSVFPIFPSSLSYALVRDFAYPAFHPLHYGPQPYDSHAYASESGTSSPAYPYTSSTYGHNDRRLSDPPPSWEGGRGMWSAGPWGGDGGAIFGIQGGGAPGDQLPSTSFNYDSDEDGVGSAKLAKNHRKSKSFASGEETTGPNSRHRRSHRSGSGKRKEQKKDMSHLGTGLDSQGFFTPGATDYADGDDDAELDTGLDPAAYLAQSNDDEDQYQQQRHMDDAADESFAGPSLALYTFQPENANELALREGQIIQVGYRHGQGWLVAMDLETGEQGLVPEEYVRLLRDIDGWGEEDEEAGEYAGEDETEDVDVDGVHPQTDGGDPEAKVGDVEAALGKSSKQGEGEGENDSTPASATLPDRSRREIDKA